MILSNERIEQRQCSYNTKSFVDSINQFKHIIHSVARLGTPRVYFQSKQTDSTSSLKIGAKNEGSVLDVYLTDLMGPETKKDESRDEFDENEMDTSHPKRDHAGVQIDTKKLALYLSGLLLTRDQMKDRERAKVCFDIEHNKCLKLTLDYEVSQGEKMYQSLLLLHSLNN